MNAVHVSNCINSIVAGGAGVNSRKAGLLEGGWAGCGGGVNKYSHTFSLFSLKAGLLIPGNLVIFLPCQS